MADTTLRRNAGLGLDARGLRLANTAEGRLPRIVLDIERLTIPAQGHAAFFGPAGSGKSKLLRAIVGLEPPARGEITWGAINIAAMDTAAVERWRRETVGVIASRHSVFRRLTALQYVLIPDRVSALRGLRVRRERAITLLRDRDVDPDATLSMLTAVDARYVEFARAVLYSPSIVIADEPTRDMDGLDAITVESALRRLCAAVGATLLVATRDAAIAARFDLRYDLVNLSLRAITTGEPVCLAPRARA